MIGLRTVLPKPLPSTPARRIAAGRAAGRSFRDKMGDSAETWQFDEISRLVMRSRETREFARGVLEGLHDDSLRGFVWLAHSAFGLALKPVDAELSAFWHTLGTAASHVVGESSRRSSAIRLLPRMPWTRDDAHSPPEDWCAARWRGATRPESRRAIGLLRASAAT